MIGFTPAIKVDPNGLILVDRVQIYEDKGAGDREDVFLDCDRGKLRRRGGKNVRKLVRKYVHFSLGKLCVN